MHIYTNPDGTTSESTTGNTIAWVVELQADGSLKLIDGHPAPLPPAFAFALPDGLTADRPFDGMAFGTFCDMWGREVVLDETHADAYIKNTKANILATQDEDGVIVGLPIDAMGHNHGHAAGFIVDVFLEQVSGEPVIRFVPRWNELGIELIKSGEFRYFSPEVDIEQTVIVGGSLTNWPASRGSDQKIKLRPIALQQQGQRKEPMLFNELSKEDQELLLAAARAQVEEEAAAAGKDDNPAALGMPKFDASKLEGMSDVAAMRAEFSRQMEEFAREELGRLQANQGKIIAQMMGNLRREQKVVAFCEQIVSGSSASPFGLPIKQAKLQAFLSSLNEAQQNEAMELFETVRTSGRVDFSEEGSNGQGKPASRELPADIVAALERGSLKIEDLSSPIIAPALGDLSEYDLSKYQGEVK